MQLCIATKRQLAVQHDGEHIAVVVLKIELG